MIDEARKMIDALRNSYGYSERRDKEAADLIEELSANLEAAKEREKGLLIMLTSAQSAAETWERKYKEVLSRLETTTQERDAAVADIRAMLVKSGNCHKTAICDSEER